MPMKKSEALFGVARLPLDMVAMCIALFLSYRLRQASVDFVPGRELLDPAIILPQPPYYLSHFVIPSIVVFALVSAALGLYRLRSTLSAWREMGLVALATLLWMMVVIAWYFLVVQQLFFSRAILFYGAFFTFVFVALARTSLVLIQRALLRSGRGRIVVVSVGSQGLTDGAKDVLTHDDHYAYLGHLQSLESLRRLVHQRDIDLVLQTDPNPASHDTFALIDYCRSHQVGYAFLPPVLTDVPHQLRVEKLGLLPLVRFQPTPLDGWGRVAKRIFDIAVSLFLLIIFSPVFLIIAIAVYLDGGWPVFFVSKRVGEQGRKTVEVLKFRSMVKGADAERAKLMGLNHRRDGPLFKVKNDPRITRVGTFLRRWTLDELPQLLNVFLGQLSLVGPRPHLREEVDRYSLTQRRVFAVKPGMTGLAQVSGRSDLSFEDEIRLDLQYIEEWSLLLDLWILWRTVFTVLGRKGAD